MGNTYRMADRLVGGRLRELLSEYRSEGLSWDAMTKRLYEHGVEVSGPTLQSWADKLGIEKEEVA